MLLQVKRVTVKEQQRWRIRDRSEIPFPISVLLEVCRVPGPLVCPLLSLLSISLVLCFACLICFSSFSYSTLFFYLAETRNVLLECMVWSVWKLFLSIQAFISPQEEGGNKMKMVGNVVLPFLLLLISLLYYHYAIIYTNLIYADCI